MRIGIDLMGGDNPPELLFEAVLRSVEQYSPAYTFVLFATQPVVDELHVKHQTQLACLNSARLEFHVVENFITMADEPLSAVRAKKRASILAGVRLLKKQHLDAFISSGNTGALIAASALLLPMLPGITRPALLATLPTKKKPVAIIDIGGNLYCKSQHLVQFAQMGAVYQRCRESIACPRVGLLNIGAESKKGTKEVRQAYQLLQELSLKKGCANVGTSMQFSGNVEAREVFDGGVDVLVTDGFTGNILLKAAEGTAGFILDQLKTNLKEGALKAAKGGLSSLLTRYDYCEYPGALVCGVDGVVIKCHGNATPRALYHSILSAISLVEKGLVKKLKASLIS